MSGKKRKPQPPFLRPSASAPKRMSALSQLQSWFRKYPALRPAYTEACRRFSDVEGVCGIGIGTTGALIRFEDNSCYGISAGHVFTDAGSISARRPQGTRAMGVEDKKWQRVQGSRFYPITIRTAEWIRDQMLFPLPAAFRPAPDKITWPDGFLKELATQADIERAVRAETATGFIWVDRRGQRPEAIPVDLEAGLPLFKVPVQCGNTVKTLTYVMTWPLRFLTRTQRTLGGDSGAPVFLWTEDNSKCRLLGMHFLKLDNHAYAMDVRAFFREVLLATPKRNVWFV
jgi:hypothetical protein